MYLTRLHVIPFMKYVSSRNGLSLLPSKLGREWRTQIVRSHNEPSLTMHSCNPVEVQDIIMLLLIIKAKMQHAQKYNNARSTGMYQPVPCKGGALDPTTYGFTSLSEFIVTWSGVHHIFGIFKKVCFFILCQGQLVLEFSFKKIQH